MAYNATQNPTDFIRSSPNLSGMTMPQLAALRAQGNQAIAGIGEQTIKTKGDIARTMLSNAPELASVFGGMQTGAAAENYLNLPALQGIDATGFQGPMTGQLDGLRLADLARRASGSGGGGGSDASIKPGMVLVDGYGMMPARDAAALQQLLRSTPGQLDDDFRVSPMPGAPAATPRVEAGNSETFIDMADIAASDDWVEDPNSPGTYINERQGLRATP